MSASVWWQGGDSVVKIVFTTYVCVCVCNIHTHVYIYTHVYVSIKEYCSINPIIWNWLITELPFHLLPPFLFSKIVEWVEGYWHDHLMPTFVSLRCTLSKKLFSWMCSWWISITYNLNKSKFLIILDYIRVERKPEQLLEAKRNERKLLTHTV